MISRRAARLRAVSILSLAVLSATNAFAADPATGSQSSDESRVVQILRNTREPDNVGGRRAPEAETRATPDLTGVWYFLKTGDRSAARADLERLKLENPDWTPPSDLVRAFVEAPQPQNTADIGAGRAERDGWIALRKEHPSEARDLFRKAMTLSGGVKGREGLARTLLKLGDPDQAVQVLDGTSGLRKLLAEALVARAQLRSATPGAQDAVLADLARAAEIDGPMVWETAGWSFFNAKSYDLAAETFGNGTTEGTVFGRVLALQKTDRPELAADLACLHGAMSARLSRACADALAERQLAAYQAGDYAAAVDLGRQVVGLDPERVGAATLAAWASLKLGNADTAADRFAAIYDRKPTHEIAVGLEQSLRMAGRDAELARRIAAGDKELQALDAERKAEIAWSRKEFDLAARLSDAYPALQGRSNWSLTGGMERRHLNGEKGLDRLSTFAQVLGAEGMLGETRVAISVTSATLSTGAAASDAALGTMPPMRYPALSEADVVIPSIAVRREWPGVVAEGKLSSTPLSAPVSARPTGEASLRLYEDPFSAEAQLFSRSVVSSLLSYAGTRDPATGETWGRVTDNGIRLQGVYGIDAHWGTAVTLEAAHLEGENVADNDRWMVRGDLAYDFKPDGFAHFRLGPYVSAAHFSENLSHYTLGHGGYYSPDQDQRTGLLLDILTAEGQRWQVESKTSVGFAHAEEAASPMFPTLGSQGGAYDATTTNGVGIFTTLRATWLAAPRLMVSGFAQYADSPGYNDLAMGVFITIPFTDRLGVVSADLPTSSFATFR